MNKYKRILQLVLLFAGGFVAGGLIMAVFILGFRAITAV